MSAIETIQISSYLFGLITGGCIGFIVTLYLIGRKHKIVKKAVSE